MKLFVGFRSIFKRKKSQQIEKNNNNELHAFHRTEGDEPNFIYIKDLNLTIILKELKKYFVRQN